MTTENLNSQENLKIPRVSIGMPVYNGEQYIEETLDSVLSQTFQEFILYIADNASTDRTEEICRSWAKKDSRIVYIRNKENIGAARNYEVCFAPAQSEYFRWQSADDPIEPNLIEECLKVLDADPSVVLAYGKSDIIDGKGNFVRKYDDNLELMQLSPVERFITCLANIDLQNLTYGLIRREALEKTARVQAFVSSDINLIAELTLYGKFFEIQKHLFNCRRHEKCSSWDMSDSETLRRFYNPSKNRLFLQSWRAAYEFYKAVIRAPISFKDKKTISYFLLKYNYWRKHVMFSELSDFIRFVILRMS